VTRTQSDAASRPSRGDTPPSGGLAPLPASSRPADIPSPDDPAVSLRSVATGYGGTSVLRELSLHVGRGEFVGIVGPSGSGKTTLLRLLTGRAEHHGGEVEVLGTRVRPGRAPDGVGYVPQLEAIDWDFPATVEQVVLLGDTANSAVVPWFSRAEKRRAWELIERLGLGGLERRQIRALSGGQRQRMFLARALLRRSELLLLDEPTSGVDLATRGDVLRLLGDLHHLGLTVVLTTHDLNFVAAHLPRVVCLNGEVTADGAPADVLTPDALCRTYGAPMRVLHDRGRVVVVDAEQSELHAGPDHLTGAVQHDVEPDHVTPCDPEERDDTHRPHRGPATGDGEVER
jgi:zinc/manganese transport system ATP-binding protein